MTRWILAMVGAVSCLALVGVGCGGDDPAGTGGAGGTGGTGGSGGGACDPATCPDDEVTECRVTACMGEACGYMDLAEGTACSAGVCSPVGTCVECNEAADCDNGEMCAGNECIPDACMNGMQDGDESDVDCGGAQCAPCGNGDGCGSAGDCESNYCDGTTCAACTPGDCAMGQYCNAGVCTAQKSNGQGCGDGAECSSGNCVDGLCCDATCMGTCFACNISGSEGFCTAHADGTDPDAECGADSCNGNGECRCADGVMNNAETDVDCGGGTCAGCADGQMCAMPSDCQGGVCTNGTCAGLCANNQLDPGETDTDCGGPNCPACADNLMCLMPSDCQSGVCNTTCQAATCSDGVTNGNEPAIDCGGGCPMACPDNSACNQPSDCQSGVCTGNTCQAPSCMDATTNGQETDVDCGGPTCPDCNAGQMCLLPSDCVTGICTGNVCQCSPALNPLADSSGPGTVQLPNLVMSEISPGNYIELYNTTGAAIALSGVSHQLCSPFAYAALSTLAGGTVVPAGGYATIPWPSNFTDVNAGGEVILYANAAFGNSSQILDFTCWGVNPHGSRKSQAEAVGKWSGACNAGALTNSALHRLVSTTGTTAASYSTTAAQSPMNCTP